MKTPQDESRELRSAPPLDSSWLRGSTTLLRGGLVALIVAVSAGLLGVFHYIESTQKILAAMNLDFAVLRPLHTTFASAWIFLGGLAVVHRYMAERGGRASSGDRLRMRVMVISWTLAGALALITLAAGVSSGREYMGFNPLISIPIALGWVMFGWNFFRTCGRGFWKQPVYVTMWGTGVLFFAYTFAEQHAWLLPGVFDSPITDLRVQWKACGTLVGSFNLFIYGSLIYLGEKMSGDGRYGQSRLAYALFAVGLLNSFTNFAHHTYHLPQGAAIGWISFIVSMIEVILLVRVVWDVVGMISQRQKTQFNATRSFLVATKWWTTAMLFTSIIISIPPLNSLIHGTQVVTAHAMGTEIGIDSMVLFAALSFLLSEAALRRSVSTDSLHSRRMHRWLIILNISVATLVLWLHITGTTAGVARYLGQDVPAWLPQWSPLIFAIAGVATTVAMVGLLHPWLRAAFSRTETSPAEA